MEHKIYHTEFHVVEIVNVNKFGFNGTKTDTWIWEITIANHGTTYLGKAVESKKNQSIDWVELKSMQPLNEMIELCKKKITANS
ncbi:hypothetical protein [Paenibacillus amylolyticus]|uniref:Uncharacterized protein n=1 Tax=Paenibacillus amylolyticus TaxID=1451 RepID=A0A100VM57_PAEAM|nr:hypothetical protein [Paenibacillus amylolyticus]GAS82418.1 unknown protein [Paenibacillus amylolyticus]